VWLQRGLVCLVGILAYANTIGFPFTFDDLANIPNNPAIKNFTGWGSLAALRGNRLVGDLSFVANYQLHGASVWGYHLVNLLIHLGGALLLHTLALLLFRTPFVADETSGAGEDVCLAGPVALLAAILFVVHPIQTQAVTYTVQRFTSLATFFYLAAVVFYLRARLAAPAGTGGRRGTFLASYLLGLVATILAMKTKEIAFTAPFAIVLVELLFFRGGLLRRAALVVPYLLTLPIVPLQYIKLDFFTKAPPPAQIAAQVQAATRMQTAMDRLDYLYTQLRVIVTYLRLLIFPVNQNLDYDYPVYRTFLTPPVYLSALLLAALLGLAIFLVVRSSARRLSPTADRRPPITDRLIAFGIFWFFLTLTVESSIIPIIDVLFEHRVYLPSVGFFLVVAVLAVLLGRRLAGRSARFSAAGVILAALVVALLVGATVKRNQVWADERTLWEDVTRKSPNRSRPWNNLGYAYLRNTQPQLALKALLRSIAIDPGHADAWNNVGIALEQVGVYAGRFRTSRVMFQSPQDLAPEVFGEWLSLGYNNVGLAYDYLGERANALKYLEKAVRGNPSLAEARYNLGLALLAAGDRPRAREQYEALRQLDPLFAAELGGKIGE
jgi:tetratricopeptide (TPR) repeat protein